MKENCRLDKYPCLQQFADHVYPTQALQTSALDHFALPGDPSFPLNALYQPPADRSEAETMRGYISQMRQELVIRLLNRVYADGTGKPSKVRNLAVPLCAV